MRPSSCGGARCWQYMVQRRITCTVPLCGLPSTNPQTSCLPCLLSGAQCTGIVEIPGSCAQLAAASSWPHRGEDREPEMPQALVVNTAPREWRGGREQEWGTVCYCQHTGAVMGTWGATCTCWPGETRAMMMTGLWQGKHWSRSPSKEPECRCHRAGWSPELVWLFGSMAVPLPAQALAGWAVFQPDN